MNYVITGGAGNISQPLAELLLNAGHSVTVVGRTEKHLEPLTAKGAKAAVGSVEDVEFLTQAFSGADAVYAMVPPNMSAADWKGWIAQIGKNYAAAIKASGIKKAVLLSSIGANMPTGAGPVSGLFFVEEELGKLENVDIKILRPASFYPNLFSQTGMIKGMGIMGANYGSGNRKIPLVHPEDIAEAAAEELLNLNFTGTSIRYIGSDEKTGSEIASIIGNAIGKPDLAWIEFTDEQFLDGALKAGLPEEVAKNYTEMGAALRSGKMTEGYFTNRPDALGKRKLEEFAKVFASVYNSNSIAAH